MIEFVLSSFLNVFILFFVQAKLLKEKINFKSLNFYLVLVSATIFLLFSYTYIEHFLKIIINFSFFLLVGFILYNKEKSKIIIATLLTFLSFFISELIFFIFSDIVIKFLNLNVSLDLKTGKTFIPNLIISLNVFLVFNIKKILFKIDKIFNNIKFTFFKTFLTSFFIILIYSFLIYCLYYNLKIMVFFFLTLLAVTLMAIFIFLNFKIMSYNDQLEKEYQKLITNLNEYEKCLEIHRIINHENKNNLIILKGMAQKNKEIVQFIDNVLKERFDDDIELLCKTKKIPIGGLQGLIYQKLLLMKRIGINYHVEVSKQVNKDHFKNLSSRIKQNICKITSILLDNAIEEVEKLEKKYISIYIYIENDYLIISISNVFSKYIEIDKIDNKQYSNKSKERGYGLSIVKQILNHNKKITLKREIITDIFKQMIKIKM